MEGASSTSTSTTPGGTESSRTETATTAAEVAPPPVVVVGFYACKRCGHQLGVPAQVAPHEPGPGQQAFAWSKREQVAAAVAECTSLFMHDKLEWMGELADVEGKLVCPRCAYRVGSYHWSGAQCSCGHWSTPAIQLQKKRIDERRL